MGILLCEFFFREVWRRNENVMAEIGQILHIHTRGSISSKGGRNKIKHKIYNNVIRPTMTYGAECWTMKKKDEMLMNKPEMRMLR